MLTAFLIGNLGADAEIIRGEFISFRVAHTTKTRNGETSYQSTTWISVTAGMEKEKLVPYLKRGTKVFISGPITGRVYVGHDGANHAGLNIRAREIEFCSSRQDTEEEQETKYNNEPVELLPF